MSASASAMTKAWTVGQYTATLTVTPLSGGLVHAVIEWEPKVPAKLTPDELELYRLGRDAALDALGLTRPAIRG